MYRCNRPGDKDRQPGREAEITVLRDGVEHTMTVTLMAATEKMIAEEIGGCVVKDFLD